MSKINPYMFRDYDIRGVAGKDLTVEAAGLIGRAFGTFLKRNGEKEVVVGRDCRLSSPDMSKALVAGLLSTGCDVKEIGLASWGFINYVLRQENGNAVFVSASHNPPEYNGFKMVAKRQSLLGAQIKELFVLVEKGDFTNGAGEAHELNLLGEYVSFLKSKVKPRRKVKVVVDCGNGMGALVGPRVFRELGCDVTVLYGDLDGRFPNHPADPVVPENLRDLVDAVKKSGAEFGVAFDGDGDRLGVVDEKGNILWGDQLAAIFAKEILTRKAGAKIVFEVNCSQALAEVVKNYGGLPFESRVGHSFIEEALRKEKALLAAEISGHIFFADDFYGIDDAVYVALRFLQLVSGSQKPVSTFLDDYPSYYASRQYRPFCPDDKKYRIVEQLTQEFQEEGRQVSTLDGAKVLFDNGWGIIRASNTQPALTFRAEAKTPEALEKIKKIFFEKLAKHEVKTE